MEKSVVEQKCSSHGQVVLAFDLHPMTGIKEMLLCIKCLKERIPQKKWIELIIDAEEKLKEAKLKEFNDKKKLIQYRLDTLLSINAKLKDLQKQINSCINQANNMLNEKIYEVEGLLKKLVQPKFNIFDEKDLLYLSNYQNSEYKINSDFDDQQEIEFVRSVKKQLQKLFCENSIKELSKILEGLLYQNNNEEGGVDLLGEKEDESFKTLALNYGCEKHNKEIIMINLDSVECESRLYCITCIVQNPSKLIDLKEANKLWQQLRQNGFQTQKTRVEKQNKIEDIMMNFQKKNNILQNELAELIYKQSVKVQNRIKFLDFDQDNLSFNGTLIQLAQKDKQNSELQKKIQLEESSYSKQLLQKFIKMEENQNECTQFINQLLSLNFCCLETFDAIFSVKNLDLLKLYISNSKSAQFEAQFFDVLIPQLLKQHQTYQQEVWQQIIEQIKIYLQQLKSVDIDQSKIEEQSDKVLKYQKILKGLKKQFYVQDDYQDFSSQTDQKLEISSLCLNQKYITQPIRFSISQPNRELYNNWKYDFAINYNVQRSLKFCLPDSSNYINISNPNIAISDNRNPDSLLIVHVNPVLSGQRVYAAYFKINQLYEIRLGICQNNTSSYSCKAWNQVGHGFYALDNTGLVYSHHDQKINENLPMLVFLEVIQQKSKQICILTLLNGPSE